VSSGGEFGRRVLQASLVGKFGRQVWETSSGSKFWMRVLEVSFGGKEVSSRSEFVHVVKLHKF
jgi:hypothetical protein